MLLFSVEKASLIYIAMNKFHISLFLFTLSIMTDHLGTKMVRGVDRCGKEVRFELPELYSKQLPAINNNV